MSFRKIETASVERFSYGVDFVVEIGTVKELDMTVREIWLTELGSGTKKLLFGKDVTDTSSEEELLAEIERHLETYAMREFREGEAGKHDFEEQGEDEGELELSEAEMTQLFRTLTIEWRDRLRTVITDLGTGDPRRALEHARALCGRMTRFVED